MEKCNPKTLVEGQYFCISKCGKCNRIGLYYRSLLIGFTLKNFASFCTYLTQIDFDRYAISTPGYEKKVVIDTCHQDIQMVFDKTEFEELKDIASQANIMLEAYALLHAT